jgi:hypothetical protein
MGDLCVCVFVMQQGFFLKRAETHNQTGTRSRRDSYIEKRSSAMTFEREYDVPS